jgi:outer membrane protein assembly factor BamB
MLDDAKAEAARLIAADSAYRNTVVVLVVGGGEGTTSSGADPVSAAMGFKNVSSHRVPIYVVAIAPPAADTTQLKAIAANSGGQYVEVTAALIDAVAAGAPVPELVRAVNTAVQHAFAAQADFNTAPTARLPWGPSTEYPVAGPIVGTVDLANAVDIGGNALPYSVITSANGDTISQRSNVLVTTGVAVPGPVTTPGFPGVLRAFRLYRPVPDNTRTIGFRFVGDGTPLWVARTPKPSEGSRNIFTALPDGTIVAFSTDNAALLAPYLNDKDAAGVATASRAADLIAYVRDMPLGAFLDSTPAILDAPSLNPPPDSDYPRFAESCRDRRALIFVGGNDGMMHAVDGRTGVEVWAFIPANLLPKLRALREGQPVDTPHTSEARTYADDVSRAAEGFRFFVDGSAKLADVKIAGEWRSLMVFGEGPGGTFYQAFDVTMADLGAVVPSSSSSVSALLAYFNDRSRVPFKWSFPAYAHFDYALSTGVTPYGDLDAKLATAVEKSVGQTWSTPAIGQVTNASGPWVALVGSGVLPYSQQRQGNRADAPAGTTLYVLDIAAGAVLDSKDVGNDGLSETADDCVAARDCTTQRNALQSDAVAIGPPNSRFLDLVYVGDLDGRVWRFMVGLDARNAAVITRGPVKLFDATASQPLYNAVVVVRVGPLQQYLFFGGGSDLLPSTGVSQAYKLFGVLDQAGTGLQKFVVRLADVNGTNGSGEHLSAYPAVAGDIVFFTTKTDKAVDTGQPSDATLYALTFIGGPAYDNNGDNRVDDRDTPKVRVLVNAGRATAPFAADRHLVFAAGGRLETFGDPQDYNTGVGQTGARIVSWREIR